MMQTWNRFISREPVDPFHMFGTAHLLALLLLLAGLVWIYFYFRKASPELRDRGRQAMAWALVLSEITYFLWDTQLLTRFDPTRSLPLHLCGWSILLCAVMLWRRSYLLFEIMYFAGIGGAIQALATPYLVHGFPHFRFFQLFISHGLILAAVIFLIASEGYRPRPMSMVKALLFLVLIAPIVGTANYLMQFIPPHKVGNYLFLSHKPHTASILDVLPEWPIYLIFVFFMAGLCFVILYLPFLVKDLMGGQDSGRARKREDNAH